MPIHVAIVPCRKGSKGIPQKAIRSFCGKPLIQWTIDAALESELFSTIIVTSDWEEIRKIAQSYNSVVSYYERPPELCHDEAPLDASVIWLGTEGAFGPEISDTICILQPTSPLRTAGHIKEAYKLFEESKQDSLVSVYQDPMLGWVRDALTTGPAALYRVNERPNRQARNHWCKENGAIYITKPAVYSILSCRINIESVVLYEMPKSVSIEMDDEIDWMIGEALCSATTP